MGDPIYLIAYVLLGAVAGMIYSLRRIFKLEQMILNMETNIMKQLAKGRGKAIAKPVKAKKKKAKKKKRK